MCNKTDSQNGKNARRLLGYSAVSWIGALIGLLVIPVSTRLFSEAELGKVNLFISAATIVYTVALLGLDQGLIRFFYECDSKSERGGLFAFCAGTSVVACCVVALFAGMLWGPLTEYLVGEPNGFIALCFIVVVTALVLVRFASSYWRAAENMPLYSVFSLASIAIQKLSYFFGALVGATYVSGIASTAVFGALCIALFLAACFPLLRLKADSSGRLSYSDVLRYSMPLMPATLLSTANGYLPAFFLRSAGDFSEVGIYTMAVTLASCVSVFSSGINAFWPPYVFKNYRTNQGSIQLFHRAVVLVITAIVLVMMALKDQLLIILGPGYATASQYLPMLLIVPFAYTVGETAGIGIHLAKKGYLLLAAYALGITVNLVVGLLLVPRFGAFGAAMSAAACSIVVVAAKACLGEREYRSIASWRHMVGSLAILLLLSVASGCGVTGLPFTGLCLAGLVALLILFGKADLLELAGFSKKAFSSLLLRRSNR